MKSFSRFFILISLLFLLPGCAYVLLHSPLGILGAGSYPNVKLFHLKAEKHKAIRAAFAFKNEAPQFSPPPFINEKGIADSAVDRQDGYWFYFTFYDPQEHLFYYAWMREEAMKDGTSFAFDGTAHYNRATRKLEEFSRINMDPALSENQRLIKRFRLLFVEPIRKQLENSERKNPD